MNIRQKIVIAVLTVFALLNTVKWGQHFFGNPYQPIDFRTYYLSSKAFFEGSNPYEDSSQFRLWQNMQEIENRQWQNTGFPHAVTVYAPQYVWFFSFYQLFYFELAKWVQFVMNLCSILLLIWCLKQLREDLKYYLIAVALLAFRGTWYALDTGQPMIQVLTLCIFSLYLINKQNFETLPALLLAFVSFKFTLMIPIVIYLLCKKNFRVFSIYLFMVLIFNTLALIVSNEPLSMINSWQQNISRLWQYTHSFQNINGLNIISTSAFVSANYFFDIPHNIIKIVSAVFLFAGLGFSLYTSLKNSAKAAMLLACVTGLCFGHHLVYDLLSFICFLLIVKDEKLVDNFLFYMLALTLILPVGSIAGFLHAPWLNFVLPMILLAYWCFLLYHYFPSKNKAIKNPSRTR